MLIILSYLQMCKGLFCIPGASVFISAVIWSDHISFLLSPRLLLTPSPAAGNNWCSWSFCNGRRLLHGNVLTCCRTEVKAFTRFVLFHTFEAHQLWMHKQLMASRIFSPRFLPLSRRSVMDVYTGGEIVCSDPPGCCQQEIGGGETSVSCDRKKPCREKWPTLTERQTEEEWETGRGQHRQWDRRRGGRGGNYICERET